MLLSFIRFLEFAEIAEFNESFAPFRKNTIQKLVNNSFLIQFQGKDISFMGT